MAAKLGCAMKKNKEKDFKTTIGGQAIIEGIMMRGPQKTAIVVRGPEGLVTKVEDTVSPKKKYPILGWLFIRGVINFVLSMKIGMSALNYSASFFPEGEDEDGADAEPSKFDKWLEEKLGSKRVEKLVIGFALVLGIILALGLFVLLPTFLGSLLVPVLGTGFLRKLAETVIRLILLLGYMILVSLTKDIKRVFSYHGAEHKSIACYEADTELTVENVKSFSRMHPRCGTSFLLTVVIISLVVFLLIQAIFSELAWSNFFLRVGINLAMLPFVVAISYELNQLVGKHDNFLTRFLRAPGLWMQKITTREPDDSMIEVGIEAIRLVIPEQKGEDEWGNE